MAIFVRRSGSVFILWSATIVLSGSSGVIYAQSSQEKVQGSDVTGAEAANFDVFLDAHTDIDKDLRANPSLINNNNYVQAHPQLKAFLGDHPRVQEELKENPSFFVQRERRFDAREPGRNGNANPDVTRRENAAMDGFLDGHTDIDKQLRANPSLINNANYLQAHPTLQVFLNDHPTLREEFRENPSNFMNRENRYDAAEPPRTTAANRDTDRDVNGDVNRDRDAGSDRDAGRNNPNPDVTRRENAAMDGFLDGHTDIDKQLRANPSLINNANYLQAHPTLQVFLNDHPTLREEFRENPSNFMNRENRYDAAEPPRTTAANRDTDRDVNGDVNRDRDVDRDTGRATTGSRNANPDLTNREVGSMDQFLDDHKNIAKDLEKKPELVNQGSYLKHHKDLQEFLSVHPGVREEVKENPSYFMKRENRLEAGEMDRNAANPDLNKKELQQMDKFLDKHKNIAKDLQKDPSLANDHVYLRDHKNLRSFLAAHANIGEELKDNPTRFMQKQAQFERMRSENAAEQAKAKTKLEEKENTHATPPH